MALRWALASTEEGGMLFADERTATRHVGKGAYAGLEFLHVNARTIINAVPAQSAMPFRFTINCYRGCSHACSYCFARPTHEYLGLDIGSDFERRIVVKINAVERLRAEVRAAKWGGDTIAMGTNTDPYQHAEGKYHLTRGIIDVLAEARNPFSILTKSTLILRDTKALVAAAARTGVAVSFSIGTLDRDVWKLTEPGTPPPDKRVEALRRLSDAGISCGVLVAPVLPGLSDREDQITEVVEACAQAGAASIHGLALHLRGPMRAHYADWLARTRPDLSALYAERFKGGAYQPQRERDRVADLVRRAALDCGVTGRDAYERTAPVQITPSTQLSLL
jgi:DNA repair photolyase